jgi:Fe-S oxidoreductase
MRLLKNAADPDHLLNPGKLLDTPVLDSNLRYGAEYRSHAWKSNLSFAGEGGLELAIEQCNGQGVCRQDIGVMCPSYQATREEMHSTRGRANLLRALIRAEAMGNGPSSNVRGLASFDPEKVEFAARALDLCLACKGCKSECPSGVDLAKLKFAFQAEYYKTHPRQLRDYVFGYFHIAAAIASSVAPLTNAIMDVPALKNTVARILGITDRRPFPKFSNRRAQYERSRPGNPKIIFLPDAFSRYVEPDVEQAALDILSKCGYDVRILPMTGAGATFLSKGFIDQARRHAARILDALNQLDPSQEACIVGIEPPEIYCLKHDHVDLLPDREAEIKSRARNVWPLDEYLLRSAEFSLLRVVKMAGLAEGIGSYPRKVCFHPHCHQRAEGLSEDGLPTGTAATLELLRSCGFDVEVMNTGCCGMAGTFGYEAEHFDLSMKVGELKLFPQLREMQNRRSEIEHPNSLVVSSGAACRMQIQQGTGLAAIHPILLVAEVLNEATTYVKT